MSKVGIRRRIQSTLEAIHRLSTSLDRHACGPFALGSSPPWRSIVKTSFFVSLISMPVGDCTHLPQKGSKSLQTPRWIEPRLEQVSKLALIPGSIRSSSTPCPIHFLVFSSFLACLDHRHGLAPHGAHHTYRWPCLNFQSIAGIHSHRGESLLELMSCCSSRGCRVWCVTPKDDPLVLIREDQCISPCGLSLAEPSPVVFWIPERGCIGRHELSAPNACPRSA